MYVCFVRHDMSKEYLFDCTANARQITPGTPVYCDTSVGVTGGTATSRAIHIMGTEEDLREVVRKLGAYWPLKKIVAIQAPLSNADKERIAREWLQERLGNQEMPF